MTINVNTCCRRYHKQNLRCTRKNGPGPHLSTTFVVSSLLRFIGTGVWDFVSIKEDRHEILYPCCPEPYYELVYTLIFRRQASFYISYLILPTVFLSLLSVLVFYLPVDCGEKLTLSITNLLALVVFQQLIAETMPPSGDASPLIGK